MPANGVRQVVAQALQSAGDHSVNASTVLPWALHALGAPGAVLGLLVPLRESLSMLPRVMLTPLELRARHRKAIGRRRPGRHLLHDAGRDQEGDQADDREDHQRRERLTEGEKERGAPGEEALPGGDQAGPAR